jgi:hypothetical protein
MNEIWVNVKEELYNKGGFGQTYSVSNLGMVKNNKTGRLLKPTITNKGYYRVNLAGKDIKLHRLVALHFVENPKPNEYDQVNHKDGDKGNNVYKNLEWANNSKNQKHAHDTGLHSHVGIRNTNAKLTEEDVLFIWKTGMTTPEVEREYDLSKPYACRLVKKHVWKHLLSKLE